LNIARKHGPRVAARVMRAGARARSARRTYDSRRR
jgi:hypothetical protein